MASCTHNVATVGVKGLIQQISSVLKPGHASVYHGQPYSLQGIRHGM